MNTIRLYSAIVTLTAALVVALTTPMRAEAQVTVAFSPATDSQAGAPGDTFYYDATFTDTDTVAYYIDGIGFTSLDANASLLYSTFNGANPPLGDALGNFEVTPNNPMTVTDVFSLGTDSSIPDGTYLGTVVFDGQAVNNDGSLSGNDAPVGSDDIQVGLNSASPAPEVSESSSLMMIGLGLTFLLVKARRRQSGTAI